VEQFRAKGIEVVVAQLAKMETVQI